MMVLLQVFLGVDTNAINYYSGATFDDGCLFAMYDPWL